MFGIRKEKRIYLDNSASTTVDRRVLDAMAPYWSEHYGNAGSIHEEGRNAKNAVEGARKKVAQALNTQDRHIIFTSGGTESNNLAILGTVKKANRETVSILTSEVEHKSVIDACLEAKNGRISTHFIGTNHKGQVDIQSLKEHIQEDTVLVTLIFVNNEIGTILDVQQVAHVLRKWRKEHNEDHYPLLHIDASQAPAWLKLDVIKLGADLITLDGQKIYGPKGIGCLYVKHPELLTSILFGGGQESGLRPGTPPTPLIVGFARALEILEEERDRYVNRIKGIRDWFFAYIEKNIPNVDINGPRDEMRIAGNIHLSLKDLEGEQVVIEMDARGVAISTGSACLAEETGGSHVVKALKKGSEYEGGSIRLSLSRHTTKRELKETAEKLIETVDWLRSIH